MDPEMMTDSRWWWGVVFNACGSLALNFGSNIIKLGHYRRATASEPTSPSVGGATPKRRYFREWAIGMLLFAGGNVLNFLSFGYAAQSMLAPLGSIQFVSNLLFALIFARDTVSRNSLTSIGVIAIGCTLIVLFGSHHSQHYTAKELVAMYRPLPYVLYLSIGASLVVLFYILLLVSKRRARRPTGEEHKIWAFLLLVSYSVFSALPGSQAVLFSKSLSSLARATASGSSQAAHWYTWVLVPLFIGTAMWWVTRLNKGLQTFPPVVLVPTMQCAWMMFAVISGLIYFDEYISFNTTRAVLYCFGLLINILGVYLMIRVQMGAAPGCLHELPPAAAGGEAAAKLTASNPHVSVFTNASFEPHSGGSSVDLTGRPTTFASRLNFISFTLIASDSSCTTMSSRYKQQPGSTRSGRGGPAPPSTGGKTGGRRGSNSCSFSSAYTVRSPLSDAPSDQAAKMMEAGMAAHGGGHGVAASGVTIDLRASTETVRQRDQDGPYLPHSQYASYSSLLQQQQPVMDGPAPGGASPSVGCVAGDAVPSESGADSGVAPRQHSKMNAFRDRLRTLHRRLNSDFGLEPTAAKSALGLGQGGLPALSVFAMPGVDLFSPSAAMLSARGPTPRLTLELPTMVETPGQSLTQGAMQTPYSPARQSVRGSIGASRHFAGTPRRRISNIAEEEAAAAARQQPPPPPPPPPQQLQQQQGFPDAGALPAIAAEQQQLQHWRPSSQDSLPEVCVLPQHEETAPQEQAALSLAAEAAAAAIAAQDEALVARGRATWSSAASGSRYAGARATFEVPRLVLGGEAQQQQQQQHAEAAAAAAQPPSSPSKQMVQLPAGSVDVRALVAARDRAQAALIASAPGGSPSRVAEPLQPPGSPGVRTRLLPQEGYGALLPAWGSSGASSQVDTAQDGSVWSSRRTSAERGDDLLAAAAAAAVASTSAQPAMMLSSPRHHRRTGSAGVAATMNGPSYHHRRTGSAAGLSALEPTSPTRPAPNTRISLASPGANGRSNSRAWGAAGGGVTSPRAGSNGSFTTAAGAAGPSSPTIVRTFFRVRMDEGGPQEPFN